MIFRCNAQLKTPNVTCLKCVRHTQSLNTSWRYLFAYFPLRFYVNRMDGVCSASSSVPSQNRVSIDFSCNSNQLFVNIYSHCFRCKLLLLVFIGWLFLFFLGFSPSSILPLDPSYCGCCCCCSFCLKTF